MFHTASALSPVCHCSSLSLYPLWTKKTELAVTLSNAIIGSERKSNKWMKLLFDIPLIEVELEEKRERQRNKIKHFI